MPLGEKNLKKCTCCGKKILRIEINPVCVKCSDKGHNGFITCPKCEKDKQEGVQ